MKIKIGLEVHVQTNLKSKIFCGCGNPVNLKEEPEPNTMVCETCLGMPGSKPRINKGIIEAAIKLALALNSSIKKNNFFSRKTYFYPDNPKNFQTTQYETPIAEGGYLEIKVGGKAKRIGIKRVHMEEDAARIVHIGGIVGGKGTLVDYNRSGVPVLEVVTEPDIESPQEARAFLQELTSILDYLGVYDSSTRAILKSDANISLHGGKRVEVKEITGTKDIETALKYEIVRQDNLVRRGSEIESEVRTWDSSTSSTHGVRTKEVEEEYGYIFEPDLTRVELKGSWVSELRKGLPELPNQVFQRFRKKYKLPDKVIESLVSERELAGLFEEVSRNVSPKIAGTWIAGYLKKTLNWHNLRFRDSGLKKEWIIELLVLFERGEITDRNAEMVIRKMVEQRKPPGDIIKKYGFGKTRIDLDRVVKGVLVKNRKALEDYRKGEEKTLHFLIGLIIKETKGQVDANEIRKVILRQIKIITH